MKLNSFSTRQTKSVIDMFNNLCSMMEYLDGYVRTYYDDIIVKKYNDVYLNNRFKRLFTNQCPTFDEIRGWCSSYGLYLYSSEGHMEMRGDLFLLSSYRLKKIGIIEPVFGKIYRKLYSRLKGYSWFEKTLDEVKKNKRLYTHYAIQPFELTEKDIESLHFYITLYKELQVVCPKDGTQYPDLDIDENDIFIR